MIRKGSRAIVSIPELRAARALLGWSQTDLAEKAGLSVPTIKRMESEGVIPVSEEARERARLALETAGITFLARQKGRLGVCLDPTRRPKSGH